MDFPACIRLPYLRASGECAVLPGAFQLWPGHKGATANSWQPDCYPLSSGQADAFLRSIGSLSLDDLEVMRHNLTGGKVAAELSYLGEMSELASFSGCARTANMAGLAAVQAQKALLWRWFWEGTLQEIARIEAECNAAERRIPILLHGQRMEEKNLDGGEGISFTSWRHIVANACLFIPPEIPILAEGQMAADLEESLDFSECAPGVMRAIAPLWLALGGTRAGAAVYNNDRSWLLIRHEAL